MSEKVYPNQSGGFPFEPKVKWAALLATLLPLLVTWATGAVTSGEFIDGLPDFVTAMILSALTGAGTAAAGYSARHQNRMGAGTNTPG